MKEALKIIGIALLIGLDTLVALVLMVLLLVNMLG